MIYRVWCDEHLIFDSTLDDYKIINPKVSLELNKTGSFDFTIYPNNPNFDCLKKMKSIIRVYQDDYLIFRGRILNDEQGFYNEKQVSCEGELAFLVDTIQRPYTFKGSPSDLFVQLIENHNSQVTDENKKFIVGNVTVEDNNDYISRSDSIYSNTLDSLMDKLVNPLGGYLFVRHESDGNYIDWIKDFDILAEQTIEFGKNLIDLNRLIKGEDIATAIIPLGAKLGEDTENRLTIAAINNGIDYVFDPEAVEKYGWIFKTATWDDVTVATNLLRKGQEYLSSARNLIGSLELNAIDVPEVGENPFRIGTYVPVYSEPHRLNSKFLVSKLELQLLSPSSNKLTLGTNYETFTEQNNSDFKTQGETIKNEIAGTVNETVNKGLEYAIIESEQRTSSLVSQSSNAILSTVREDYYLKSETDKLISSVNTELTQTKNSFDFKFNNVSSDLNQVESNANIRFNEITKYIRFVDGDIVLGQAENKITLKIQNDRISFFHSGVEVAYFTDKKLYVTEGEYLTSLKVGAFAIRPRNNGNLSIEKVK